MSERTYKIDDIRVYEGVYNMFNGLLLNLAADPNVLYYHILATAIDPEQGWAAGAPCQVRPQAENIRILGIVEATTIIYHPLLQLINNYQSLSFKDYLANECENAMYIVIDVDSENPEHYRTGDIYGFDFKHQQQQQQQVLHKPELPKEPPPSRKKSLRSRVSRALSGPSESVIIRQEPKE